MPISLMFSPPHLTARAQSKAARLAFIKYGRDVQLYLKTKYNLVSTWDQEFGVQATMLKYANWSEVTNLCYDPVYPIDFNKKPRYALGFQVGYSFTTLPSKLGVYTKTKTNFLGGWKQETGLTGRLYTSPEFIVSASVAWLYNYPYHSSQKPQWLALVNLQFPLGR